MIEIRGVRKCYGPTCVLEDVDLDIEAGGVTSIIGPNGAGKSTLMGIVSRLDAPDSGTVHVDGMNVHSTRGDVLAKRLSILRQENTVGVRLSVRDLVGFGRFPHCRGRPTVEDRRHIDEAIGFLGLTELADRPIDEMSGGQRQRAFVAMVLCQNTDYVLLDEPLNNLDMRHSVEMMRLLRRAADELGRTVVLVIHDINFAAAYSDRIVAMKDGRVVEHGRPAEIMRADLLSELYDLPMSVEWVKGAPMAVYHR